MKQIFLTVLLGCLLSIGMFAESIAQTYTGNLSLHTQTDIDNFSYSEVTGNLIITEASPNSIVNLNGLSDLTTVGGALDIISNAAITNLDGLSHLKSVGGNLFIDDNFSLTNLDGLSSLISVGGDLEVSHNTALSDFSGLYALLRVNYRLAGSYSVTQNASNPSQQQIVDGGSSSVPFYGNTYIGSQADVDAFNYTEVTGDLGIFSGSAVTNLDHLSSLTSVGGYLNIQQNSAITNLDGLSNLTSVGFLSIQSNYALTNIDGLSNLTSVSGPIRIWSNFVLTNIDGLFGLTSVEYLSILGNSSLTNIDGLSGLTSVVGLDLIIDNNAALTNVDGLSNLTSVGRSLEISNNSALTNLDGLSSLISVGETTQPRSFYGAVAINGNSSLNKFCGLYPLVSGGTIIPPANGITLYISGNASNPTEQDIINGGFCYVQNIQDLVTAVEDLNTIGTLNNGQANSLKSKLIGLQSLIDNGNKNAAVNKVNAFINHVEAFINASVLTSAEAQSLINAANIILAQLNSLHKHSNSGNKTKINTTIPKNYSLSQNFPNPFNPTTVIKYALSENVKVRLIIYDVLGKQVAELVNREEAAGIYEVKFDGSSLASGIYFYRLTTDKFTKINKMILLK